jgi:hypothetical protein
VRRVLVGSFLIAAVSAAHADPNDLVMSRLSSRIMDNSGNVTSVVGQNLEMRALSSQLGVVLAPHLLTPADTVGFGGFQLTVDYATTTIDAKQSYWRALEGANSGAMQTIGLFARKGLWFPVPSMEIGGGAIHLVDSHVWTGQLYTKLALHEGYHDLLIPSLSVRGAVSRMMTQRELDLTTASLDVAISKHIGVGGTWRLDPYVGWNMLMIIPRSEVIDGTPEVDPLDEPDDIMNNFVFAEQDTIFRQRFFVGAKLQYYVFQLTLEAQFATAGNSVDDRVGTTDACVADSTTTACDATDIAASQRTLSMSAGFDF